MPRSFSLISTIAAGLGLALIFDFLAIRLKLPALGLARSHLVLELTPALPASTNEKYLSRQIVLVGSRRVEGRIAQALIAQSLPLVVEQNREVVECLRLGRIAAVAAEAEVPVQAHVDAARLLAIGRP